MTVAVLMVAALGLGGCAAGSPDISVPTPSPTASAVPTLPPGSVTLTSMGLGHAPSGFAVPSGLTPLMTINEANVVTLEVDVADGKTLHDFLMLHLPGMGWRIAASSADSIIFAAGGWQGAFTMSSANAMLTLRDQPL